MAFLVSVSGERHGLMPVSCHTHKIIPSVHTPRKLLDVVKSVIHTTHTRARIVCDSVVHVDQAPGREWTRAIILDGACRAVGGAGHLFSG